MLRVADMRSQEASHLGRVALLQGDVQGQHAHPGRDGYIARLAGGLKLCKHRLYVWRVHRLLLVQPHYHLQHRLRCCTASRKHGSAANPEHMSLAWSQQPLKITAWLPALGAC